jgi:hypothetical protein
MRQRTPSETVKHPPAATTTNNPCRRCPHCQPPATASIVAGQHRLCDGHRHPREEGDVEGRGNLPHGPTAHIHTHAEKNRGALGARGRDRWRGTALPGAVTSAGERGWQGQWQAVRWHRDKRRRRRDRRERAGHWREGRAPTRRVQPHRRGEQEEGADDGRRAWRRQIEDDTPVGNGDTDSGATPKTTRQRATERGSAADDRCQICGWGCVTVTTGPAAG